MAPATVIVFGRFKGVHRYFDVGAAHALNPPETNEAVAGSGLEFTRTVDQMPPTGVQDEIDDNVDIAAMHRVLMEEGIDKFVKPQRALLQLVAEKRMELLPTP